MWLNKIYKNCLSNKEHIKWRKWESRFKAKISVYNYRQKNWKWLKAVTTVLSDQYRCRFQPVLYDLDLPCRFRYFSVQFNWPVRVETSLSVKNITKTYLYNADPHKPQFYIIKLGLQGHTLFFLIFAQKHRLWILRTASVLRSTYNLCFEQKYEKYQNFIWKFSFFGGKIFSIFE